MKKIRKWIIFTEAEYKRLCEGQAAEVKAAREEGKKEGIETQKAKRIGLYYYETTRMDGSRRVRSPVYFREIPEENWPVDYCSAGVPTGSRGPVMVTAKEAVERSWLQLDASAEKFLEEIGILSENKTVSRSS